jgi:hypothetical protein
MALPYLWPIGPPRDLATRKPSYEISSGCEHDPMAKLTFCGGISGILLCPMMQCLDGEDAWSSLDHDTFIFLP